MNHADAFLRAILEAPDDDDAPRMLFADWLEENGESERAEFIRVQCRLEPLRTHGHGASNPHGGDCADCLLAAGLERREQEILDTPGEWSPLPGVVWPGGDSFTWERGFISRVKVPAGWWLAHADALLAAAPIREVRPDAFGL